MREIKFRAWDKENNKMFGVDFIGKNSMKLISAEWENIKDFIIMQYTGRKDKNGREIWEGDLVKHKGDRLFEIKYSEEFMRFMPWSKAGWLAGFNPKTLEVVGNIWVNPELLGGRLY